MFYERSRKGFGKLSAKVIDSATKKRWRGNAAHLLLILDEASGISDKQDRRNDRRSYSKKSNRMLMLSQPTRPSGYFWLFAPFSLKPQTTRKDLDSNSLNSEESLFVTPQFIKQKLLEYGGAILLSTWS
uniref:Uncharacterized protein n=1 Tax=Salmonella sp. TaxID=599 RepID=A0A482EW06_SALSP|nr:hypothetical protein [Salmonella sp.]QBM91439.1 hypothetical protein NNIBIDOC_00109 [Salmonella sp.]